MQTKQERYNRNTVDATRLAELLKIESKNGWIVVSAENDGDDLVVDFEKE